MSNFKAYNTGGQLGTSIGATATSFIPGVGPLLAPVGGMVGGLIGGLFDKEEKPKAPRSIGYASQGYKYGGKMMKKKQYNVGGTIPTASIPIGQDAQKYIGPKHEQGGITVNENGDPDTINPIAEVEGGETEQGGYIFSDELKIPGEDITFAQMHELLLQQNAPQEQIEQLAQMQEQVKQEKGLSENPRVPVTQNWNQKGAVTPMKKGGKLVKYQVGGTFASTAGNIAFETLNNNKPKRNIDPLNVAQYVLPSATRLATAAFAPKPKRTPKVGAERLQPETAVYRDARKRIGSGFRANPTQAGYARYIQGINQATAQEAQHRLQVEERNQRNRIRADIFNAQNTARDNDVRARDTAARIGLVDQAINAPVTAALANRRGKQQQIGNIILAANEIPNAKDRQQYIVTGLRAAGVPQQEISRILANQQRYGGKLKKVG